MNDGLGGKPPKLQSCLFSGIVAWTLAVTALRGLRHLSMYAEAHWMLDYRFGFIKRGLPGALLRALLDTLGIRLTPQLIEWLSLVPTTLFYGCIVLLSWRIAVRVTDRSGAISTMLAFVSSCFIVMNAHCIGYFDTLIYLLTIAAVALVLSGHPLLAAGLQIVALLSHEIFLLIGFPAVCLASYFRFHDETGARRKWYLLGAGAILPVFCAMLALPYFSDLDQLREQLTNHLRASGALYGYEEYVPHVITRRFGQLFLFHYDSLLQRTFAPDIWLQVGPTLAVILTFCHKAFRIRLGSRESCLLLAVCAAPLAFHLVATDTMRLTSYLICSAFLTLWILAETKPAQGNSRWLAGCTLPVLGYNALMRVTLYDHYTDRFSPAIRLLLYAPALALVAFLALRSYLSERRN